MKNVRYTDIIYKNAWNRDLKLSFIKMFAFHFILRFNNSKCVRKGHLLTSMVLSKRTQTSDDELTTYLCISTFYAIHKIIS